MTRNPKLLKARRRLNGKGAIKSVNLDFSIYKKSLAFSATYGNPGFLFSLCSKNNRNIKLLSMPTMCRETLANKVLKILHGLKPYTGSNKVELSKRRTCVLVIFNTGRIGPKGDVIKACYKSKCTGVSCEDWMLKSCKSALNLLNHLEKRNGWSQTKLYKVKYDLPNDNCLMYYFSGSKWWLHAPPAFSLFNLLIKLGKYKSIQTFKRNATHELFIKTIKHSGELPTYTRNVDGWVNLVDNRKTIYKGRDSMLSNWNSKINFYDGISNLVSGSSGDKVIQDRFNATLETYRE